LSSHRFASSIDGSLAPSFNSTLFGNVMAAVWVQENVRWDGFPSSHLGQLNSPKRNTIETAFSFFKLLLKFSDQRRKSKRRVPGKNRGRTAARAPRAGQIGPADLPRFAGQFGLVFCVPLLFRIFSPRENYGPVKLHEKLQKNKRETIYKIHTLFYVLG
jgi:hypothetical protein